MKRTKKKEIILQSCKRMGKVTIFRNPTIFHVLCEFYGYFQNRFLSWKGKVIDGIEEYNRM